jgi:hypothetical protein
MIGNTKVSSVEEAVKFEPLFKRHGPIFRRLIAALQGDVTVDVVNLQATINQKVLPPNVAELLVQTTYQGKKRTLPVEVISKPDGTVITTELQGNLCPRRVALGHKFVDSEGVDRPLQVGADVRVSFDVSSVTNIFSQPMLMGESMIRMSAKIVSFIMALLTSKDWKNTASIVTLFVSSDPSIFAYVGNKVSNALTGVSVFQGTFENIFQAIGHTLSEFWHVVVSSTILAMLKECKDSLFSVVGPVVFDLVKETKRAIGRETATNIAKTLFAWIGDILGRLKECVRTRSMKPIWGDRWNANTWIRHSLSYERFMLL